MLRAGTSARAIRQGVVPHFYFHLYNDVSATDEEGRDLPNLDAARRVAVCEAREMMTETILKGRINLGHRIEIADEAGAIVATVTFKEAVTVDG